MGDRTRSGPATAPPPAGQNPWPTTVVDTPPADRTVQRQNPWPTTAFDTRVSYHE
jgi:hypothetical protein